jgi:HK97 family phage portal protein
MLGTSAVNIRSAANNIVMRPDGLYEHFLTGQIVGGGNTLSGEAVTQSTALTLSSYLACIRNASEDIAKMPVDIDRDIGNQSWELDKNHRAYKLTNIEPNPEMSPMNMKEAANGQAMGGGIGLCVIERESELGPPEALWPVHASRVQVKRDAMYNLVFDINVTDMIGDLPRTVVDKKKEQHVVRYQDRDVLNIHGFGAVGATGYVMSALARETIAMGLASRNYAARYYGNDATPTTMVLYPDKMNKETAKRIHAEINKQSGGANRHKMGALFEGIKIQQLQVNPQDAQMIQAGHFVIEDMARFFRMPPHKIQHLLRSTFSNITEQNLEYVIDCLDSWATRWEQELLRKLFTMQERTQYRVEFNFRKLLRGDPVKRAQIDRIYWNMGALKADEIRNDIGKNPLPDGLGADYYVQSNMQKLKPTTDDKSVDPKTSLNGAQVTAMLDIVNAVATGAMPRDTGVAIMAASFPIDIETAEKIMGEVGASFTVEPPSPPDFGNQDDDEEPPESDDTDDGDDENALNSLREMMIDTVNKVVKIENVAVGRASKRHATDESKFLAWADDYFPKRSDYYVEALTPMAVEVARLMGKDILDAELVLSDAATEHVRARTHSPLTPVVAEDSADAIIDAIQELPDV